MIVSYNNVFQIVVTQFSDIVTDIIEMDTNSIRIIIKDGSYLDIWYSLKLENKYSYHWERRAIDNTIHRHDNAAHLSWKDIKTFPKHYHKEHESNVIESYISDDPIIAVQEMLEFIRKST